jgi:hypothetical protein
MLTPHEQTLVLAHHRAKMTEGMAIALATSRTVQCILTMLLPSEIEQVKACKTFASFMEKVEALKTKSAAQ